MNRDNLPLHMASRLLHDLEALTELKDVDSILDRALYYARSLARAEAGSIFLVQGDMLRFSYVHNDALFDSQAPNTALYESFTVPIDEGSVVGYVAKTGRTAVIDDAYDIDSRLPYRHNHTYDERTGYRTMSMYTVPLESAQKKLVGVMQIINARDDSGRYVPFDKEAQAFVPLLASSAASAIERGIMNREMILRMMRMAELRDPAETGAHVQRVGAYSAEIYKRWALERLKSEGGAEAHDVTVDAFSVKDVLRNADVLRLAAMLHDVGKIGIPDSILKKPRALTDDEFQLMKWHTVYGARLFATSTSTLDKVCYDVALGHHERWSGEGYPGLIEDIASSQVSFGAPCREGNIPLAARIVAIADVYDALTSKRAYKQGWPEDKVLTLMENESGGHFDPELVGVFFDIYDVIKAIRAKFVA